MHAGELSTLFLKVSSGTVNDKDGYIKIVKKTSSIDKFVETTHTECVPR